MFSCERFPFYTSLFTAFAGPAPKELIEWLRSHTDSMREDVREAVKGGARVLFADMDDLKGINDAYGHDVGDEAIKACARVIRESCRPEDFIIRYGGDEFLIICALDEDALAETIQAGLCDFNRRSGRAFRLALSIGGVDTESQGETDLEKCVQAADRIMYAAKSQRKKLKKQEE